MQIYLMMFSFVSYLIMSGALQGACCSAKVGQISLPGLLPGYWFVLSFLWRTRFVIPCSNRRKSFHLLYSILSCVMSTEVEWTHACQVCVFVLCVWYVSVFVFIPITECWLTAEYSRQNIRIFHSGCSLKINLKTISHWQDKKQVC